MSATDTVTGLIDMLHVIVMFCSQICTAHAVRQLLTLGLVSGSLQSFADLIRSGVMWYIPADVSFALQVYILLQRPSGKAEITSWHKKLLVLV